MGRFGAQRIRPNWPRDILYRLIAQLLEGVIKPVAHLFADDPADTDPSWLGQSFMGSVAAHHGCCLVDYVHSPSGAGAVADGDLTPSEAGELAKFVDTYVRTLEASEF
jgi:hypothetical protein